MQTPLVERDYFTDYSILKDPYKYFEAVRANGPVYCHPAQGIVFVTGFDEAVDVLTNAKDFSSLIAGQGPAAPLPFVPEGADITSQIEASRLSTPGGSLVTNDGNPHAMSRSILSRLFTPSRLRANEKFMAAFADNLVANAVERGRCKLVQDIATPFVTLVIADLLGVPADDRQKFMDVIKAAPPAGSMDEVEASEYAHPLIVMGGFFFQYVQDRRDSPREDILSELANAKFPDGSTPSVTEIAGLSTLLFAAGQDTSAKLFGNALRFVVDEPGLQERLRADPSLIPQMLEETLRLEGSLKMTSRLAKRDTRIGDHNIRAGTKVAVVLAAANRDPRRWDDPQSFVLDRPKIKEHVAFGRGPHVCIGAPLARTEVRVIFERLLERTSNIDFAGEIHGPRGNRNLEYEASFMVRGHSEMHLTLTPK